MKSEPTMSFTSKWPARILVLVAVLTVLVCSWLPPMDDPATQQVDAGLKRALVTFGTVRLLYGAVSALQGTEFAVAPAGIGTTLKPGQILAPVAELLKTFSDLMLFVCVSFGIQKLLISIGGFWIVSLALTLAAVGWTTLYFKEKVPPEWITKTLIVLLLVRFAVPLTVLGTSQIFEAILDKEYQASQLALSSVAADAEPVATSEVPDLPSAAEASGAPGVESPSLFGRAKTWLKGKSDSAVVRFKGMKNKVESKVIHMVTLMAVFVLQTVVLPLLLLLGLYNFARVTLRMPLGRNLSFKT